MSGSMLGDELDALCGDSWAMPETCVLFLGNGGYERARSFAECFSQAVRKMLTEREAQDILFGTAAPEPKLKVVPIASKHPSNTSWSPEQLLDELAADIRAGKVRPTNLMVFWMDDAGNGALKPRRWIANVTRAEEIAFYALGTVKAVEDWRK